jgi:hypothetical protein
MYVNNNFFMYRFQRNLIYWTILSLGASLQDYASALQKMRECHFLDQLKFLSLSSESFNMILALIPVYYSAILKYVMFSIL